MPLEPNYLAILLSLNKAASTMSVYNDDAHFSERITVSCSCIFTVQTVLLQLIFYTLANFASLNSCLNCIITLWCQDGLLAVCQSPLVQLIKVYYRRYHGGYSCLRMTKLIKCWIKMNEILLIVFRGLCFKLKKKERKDSIQNVQNYFSQCNLHCNLMMVLLADMFAC